MTRASPWLEPLCSSVAPVDRGAEEDEVRPEHLLYERQRDRCGLVHHQQLRLPKLAVVLWLNVLDRLHEAQHIWQCAHHSTHHGTCQISTHIQ